MGKRRDKYNDIMDTIKDTVNTVDLRITFLGYIWMLNRYLKKHGYVKYKLTRAMKKDYVSYYKSFGFRHINTAWLKYIYALTGKYDRRYIPDDIFNIYIDSPYETDREYWQNKVYQPEHFPQAKFPETIASRMKGYYFDSNNERITQERVIELIRPYDEVVIKHASGGGGHNIMFCKSGKADENLFKSIDFDFVVQKVIRQSPLMAQFNESSVNIVKITSFMFNGEVHILSARLWAGGKDLRMSNSSGSLGYQVVVKGDGRLCSKSYNLTGDSTDKTPGGIPFSDIRIDFYDECIDFVKMGHERLFRFPFISWDFTQDDEGNTILIEYNLKWHVLYDFQALTGPAFGDITDDVLKEAAKNIEKNKSFLLR